MLSFYYLYHTYFNERLWEIVRGEWIVFINLFVYFEVCFDKLFGDSCCMTNYDDILSSMSFRDKEWSRRMLDRSTGFQPTATENDDDDNLFIYLTIQVTCKRQRYDK